METKAIIYWGVVAIVNLIVLFIAFRKEDPGPAGGGEKTRVPAEPPGQNPPQNYKAEKETILTSTKRMGPQCSVCGTINYHKGDYCEVCGNCQVFGENSRR